MPNRQRLIQEVKQEYARRADLESRNSFVDTTASLPPEAYYEKLLDAVLEKIDAGQFDSMSSGQEIVDSVSNNREKWGIILP